MNFWLLLAHHQFLSIQIHHLLEDSLLQIYWTCLLNGKMVSRFPNLDWYLHYSLKEVLFLMFRLNCLIQTWLYGFIYLNFYHTFDLDRFIDFSRFIGWNLTHLRLKCQQPWVFPLIVTLSTLRSSRPYHTFNLSSQIQS